MVCFVDDVLWGGDKKYTETVIKLRQTFHVGAEHAQIFDYIVSALNKILIFPPSFTSENTSTV